MRELKNIILDRIEWGRALFDPHKQRFLLLAYDNWLCVFSYFCLNYEKFLLTLNEMIISQ